MADVSEPAVSEVGSVYTLSSGLLYTYEDQPWVLIRHRGFWPLLRLPVGSRNQRMLTHDHRINWTFDAQLEEHVAGLDVFSGVADEVQTDGEGWVRETVPEILGGARAELGLEEDAKFATQPELF